MPKRLLWFLASLALVIAFNIAAPLMDRASMESTSVNTSLSVAPTGYKGLYLLLNQLENRPVTLWQHSIMNLNTDKPRTIWLMEPGKGLFHDGKNYARQMRELVRQGNHLVFVLDNNPLGEEQNLKDVLEAINGWFDLSLETEPLQGSMDIAVTSHFKTREIRSLVYKPLEKPAAAKFMWRTRRFDIDPSPEVFTADSVGQGKVLLETPDGEPLAIRFMQGKGSVTVFPNSFYFNNAQLTRGDNAALAVALQEMTPGTPETLFEVYSSGFNENRDFITYLATGKGIAFLVTVILLLVAFCIWIMQLPPRRRESRATSDERYFTQEVFIDSLARHYLETRDWNALYDKMAGQFRLEIDRRYPGLPLEQQIAHIAANPFFNVSDEALSGVFAKIDLGSESEFVRRSRNLLEIRNQISLHKGSGHEHVTARHGVTTRVS
jgi:hypothetical protein